MKAALRPQGLIDVVFVALTFAVGVQLLRLFITGMVFYLREVREFSTVSVGGIAFLVFGTAFLAPIAVRLLGPRRTLLAAIAVMGLARLAEQSVTSPQIDLVLAGVGVVAFLPVIPLSMAMLDTKSATGAGHWRYGLLLGLALDTAVKGGLGTLGASWQAGGWVGLVGLGLPLALLALVYRESLKVGWESPATPDVRSALPLLAIGPFLFLEMLLFQNVAQQTALIDWPQPAVLTWIGAVNGAGVLAVWGVMGKRIPWPVIVLAAVILAAAVNWERSGGQAAVVVLVGHMAAVTLMAKSISGDPMPRDSWGLSAVWTGAFGAVLFLALAFVYYAGYDIDVGVTQQAVLLAAVALLMLPVLVPQRRTGPMPERNALAVMAPFLLLVAPLALALTWSVQNSGPPQSLPIRVMSYNIHQGFGTSGDLDMEALALAIEAERPDVVALQEVSRGWMVNGSVDTMEWLSQRLEMPYVWGPAADSVWGNAILSHLPVTEVEHHSMPNNSELVMDRGFLWVVLDTGQGTRLRVIATHFHSGEGDSDLRLPQSLAVLKRWQNETRTILLGDFNGSPESREIQAIVNGGFRDAFVVAEAAGPGFTFASDDLVERIDYIFVTPDLAARDYSARVTQASDHLPIAVTVDDAP